MQTPREDINWELLLDLLERDAADIPTEGLTGAELAALAELRLMKSQPHLWEAAQRLDVDAALGKVKQRVETVPMRPKRARLAWSAAAAVLLLVAAGAWLFRSQQVRAPGVAQHTITPAAHDTAVRLLLHGEEEVLLDTLTELREQNGSAISNSNSELRYEEGETNNQSLIYNTIVVPPGKQYRLVLADGSKVWLNAASTLRFPVRFPAQERAVELTGEAYFEVAQEAEKPFMVKVSGQEVKVLGTSFNIRAYDGRQQLTLLTGKVQWRPLTGAAAAEILLPGDQLQVQDGVAKKKKVHAADHVLWTRQQLLLDGRELNDVVAELGRHYAQQFRFADNSLKDLRFNGTLDLQHEIQDVLDIMTATNKLKFTYQNGIYLIQTEK